MSFPPRTGYVLLQGDPYKTLFLARLSHEVTERKLMREFEEFGPIKRIRLVHDKNSGVLKACTVDCEEPKYRVCWRLGVQCLECNMWS